MNILKWVIVKIKRKKHAILKNKLYSINEDFIRSFMSKNEIKHSVVEGWNYPIWVCWWQGEENMPDLVKACYNSLRENANGHTVNLVTKENYNQYVKIPDYILYKADKGQISITHLSDVLRFSLLYKYGGLWIDATMLVTSPLPSSINYPFYSIKHKKKGQNIAKYRWTSFCLFTEQHSIFAKYMRDFLLEYWSTQDKFIVYLMIDYAFAIAYETIPVIKEMVDAVPYNNLRHDDLRYLMKKNAPYNLSLYKEITTDTFLHKLTWKKKFLDYTSKEEPTYYKYIKDTYV